MTDSYFQAMLKTSHLSGASSAYIDSLYEQYLQSPSSVTEEWQHYFQQLPEVEGVTTDVSHAEILQAVAKLAQSRRGTVSAVPADYQQERKQAHVLQLINAFRLHGHHHANLNPIGNTERQTIPDLALSHHNLGDADLATRFSSESALTSGLESLQTLYDALQKTYCRTLGFEYMHITDQAQIQWLQQRIESTHATLQCDAEAKLHILKRLVAADGLEKYLGSRYVGQKRFSLEGGDSLIPLLDELAQRAGTKHVKEVVIGMAHRGRLNVLVNIFGKEPKVLFEEFEGATATNRSGDVKYHMGFSADLATKGGDLHIALAFNPSHLEIIAPVVEGSVRSRQRRRGDLDKKVTVLPVVIHGDAAFAGQGVVMETFNFSQARGYSTGGTVHIVVNNQIGFTTSNPLDARSTLYCTDVAKMVQAPIIHVNGDDPEAVIFATQLAFDFRMQFKKDVVIDLVCYRRHGHNEADEPSVTQPYMYSKVRKLPTPREVYAEQLMQEGLVTQRDVDAMVLQYRNALDRGDPVVETVPEVLEDEFTVSWDKYLNQHWDQDVNTAVPVEKLQRLSDRIAQLPENFKLHPVVKRLYDDRAKMAAGDMPLNWGYAETLAYATLVDEGHPVRLSGQDSGRGTFAHRHAVVHDYNTADNFIPLTTLSKQRDQVIIIDSVLSEEAVLGFEYGFAAAEPNVLVLWEAQFGDFANGAQVVIDQFISSGEQKWGRLCGLVMLLPHGFEGQGPEHSSARLERYLQLCAQHNMQVCVPTTPAQIFHLLRRQMVRNYRKPLIVMTPKSLLRHKLAVSSLEDLSNGKFYLVIPEADPLNAKDVRKVVMCSGKVYYDLLSERRKREQSDVALVRVEQLYPFPVEALQAVLKTYPKAKQVVWCQEEPQNQGAWFSSQHHMQKSLSKGQTLEYVGRGFFASPAVGYASLHAQQQRDLVEQALA